jgi:hypothetical protein
MSGCLNIACNGNGQTTSTSPEGIDGWQKFLFCFVTKSLRRAYIEVGELSPHEQFWKTAFQICSVLFLRTTVREHPSSLGGTAEGSPRHGRGLSGRPAHHAPAGRQRCSAPAPPFQPLALESRGLVRSWRPGLPAASPGLTELCVQPSSARGKGLPHTLFTGTVEEEFVVRVTAPAYLLQRIQK